MSLQYLPKNQSRRMSHKTPKGYPWPCSDEECMKLRDEWEDSCDVYHCNQPGCHCVAWAEKAEKCFKCQRWFCDCCWQNHGSLIDEGGWSTHYCCEGCFKYLSPAELEHVVITNS